RPYDAPATPTATSPRTCATGSRTRSAPAATEPLDGDRRRRALGSQVLDRVAEPAGDLEQPLEVEVDPRSRLLRDLVLDRQVEIVCPVVEGAKGILVLRQDGRPDVLDVVEEDAAERDVPPVFVRLDLPAAQRRPVGLVRPAEEREQPLVPVCEAGVLEVARPLEMLEPLVQRLVEADHHRRCRTHAALDDRPLRFEVVSHGVLPPGVARTEVLGQDLAAPAGDPV